MINDFNRTVLLLLLCATNPGRSPRNLLVQGQVFREQERTIKYLKYIMPEIMKKTSRFEVFFFKLTAKHSGLSVCQFAKRNLNSLMVRPEARQQELEQKCYGIRTEELP